MKLIKEINDFYSRSSNTLRVTLSNSFNQIKKVIFDDGDGIQLDP